MSKRSENLKIRFFLTSIPPKQQRKKFLIFALTSIKKVKSKIGQVGLIRIYVTLKTAFICLIHHLLCARADIRDIFSLVFWGNWEQEKFILRFFDLTLKTILENSLESMVHHEASIFPSLQSRCKYVHVFSYLAVALTCPAKRPAA